MAWVLKRCAVPAIATSAVATWLGGCAGSPSGPTLTASLATPPSAASTSATTTIALGTSPSVNGTAIAVYERVAQRALHCWFGKDGPLKKTHIFNAEVTSPLAGGRADIFIHEREAFPMPGQTPRGAKVFRVEFQREAEERTRIAMESGKLPSDLADAMQKDVVAWALDRDNCDAQVVRPPPAPPPEPTPPKVKTRAKSISR